MLVELRVVVDKQCEYSVEVYAPRDYEQVCTCGDANVPGNRREKQQGHVIFSAIEEIW